MLSHSTHHFDGPQGHQDCKTTLWDYDRMGNKYSLVCECGVHLATSWTWQDVENAYWNHLKKLSAAGLLKQISNQELSEKLKSLLDDNFLSDMQKVLVEAAVERFKTYKWTPGHD